MSCRKKRNSRFIPNLLIIILGIILSSILLFFIPDLMINFHHFLYDKLNFKSNINSNKNSNIRLDLSSYMQMIISLFSCCITAILGFGTFFLTKVLREIEREKHNAKIATVAFRLYKNIKHNSWIIFDARRNLSSLDKLQYNSNLDELWFALSAAGEIDSDELKILKNYNKQIHKMNVFCEEGIETKELEQTFCNEFLDNSNEFDYKEDFKRLILKIEEIMNRRIFDE